VKLSPWVEERKTERESKREREGEGEGVSPKWVPKGRHPQPGLLFVEDAQQRPRHMWKGKVY
jgi:hypothetical protein